MGTVSVLCGKVGNGFITINNIYARVSTAPVEGQIGDVALRCRTRRPGCLAISIHREVGHLAIKSAIAICLSRGAPMCRRSNDCLVCNCCTVRAEGKTWL